jgi:4-amino-4-deoxy-L-arabinose transferase-like glycosyltransferase
MAGFLPLLGRQIFGRIGFFVGVFGGAFIMLSGSPFADQILTESVFSFFLFMVVCSWILFIEKRSGLSAILLGFLTGFAVLIKGSVIFLPLLVLITLVIYGRKSRDKRLIWGGCVATTAAFLIVTPWSLYASSRAGKFVALSTETENIFLDSHNELSSDGDWHPEWRKVFSSEGYFHSHPGQEGRSLVLRILGFYQHQPSIFLPALINKLNRAFSPLMFFTLWTYSLIALWAERRLHKSAIPKWLISTPIFAGLAFVTFSPLPSIAYILVLVQVLFVTTSILSMKESELKSAIVLLMFLNFAAITVLTYGNVRFVTVMNFGFILYGLEAVVSLISKYVHLADAK